MRYTVTYRGVPVVAVEFESGDATLELAPGALLEGYRQILAPLFRRAEAGEQNTENLARGWCMTEEARVAAEARVADGRRALARLAALESDYELRDFAGALVPTDSIHVTELSLARPDVITVFVQLRESHAPVPASTHSSPRASAGAASPNNEAGTVAPEASTQASRPAV